MVGQPFLIDGHQDIAYNMHSFGRDYTLPNAQIRSQESSTKIPQWSGDTMLGIDQYRESKVAIVFATLFAAPIRYKEGDWDKTVYQTQEEAHTLYRKQIDTYHELVANNPQQFRLIMTQNDLNSHMDEWNQFNEIDFPPVGIVLLMEGADAIRKVYEVELWWEMGVRIIGPAWVKTVYCGGTKEPGGLTKQGFALLEAMGDLGYSLDISHMDKKAALQALDIYDGNLIATHANAAQLIKNDSNRHLSNRVIEGVLERNGVIGVVPYNLFLNAEWKKGNPRDIVPLDLVANQIDYFCQIAGNSQHVAIGSDADGGFGLQSSPIGMNSLSDLSKLVPMLSEKGYHTSDIENIFYRNWLRFLKTSLPKTL
jgi:membrane dipeptidase